MSSRDGWTGMGELKRPPSAETLQQLLEGLEDLK